jgi:glycosyltransferase involved in cell wall biosynthesis
LTQELGRQHRIALAVPGVTGRNGSAQPGPVLLWPVSPEWGLRTVREVVKRVKQFKPDAVMVHFVPQLYGWNGAKPGLAALLHILKRQGCKIVTVAHEMNVPFGPSPKWMVWSVIHRVLFWMIVGASRHIVLTTEMRCDAVKNRFSWRRGDCHHIPVGNTIPVKPTSCIQRTDLAHRLGLDRDELLVVTFGSGLPSAVPLYEKLFQRMINDGLRFRVLVIGKSGSAFRRDLRQNAAVMGRTHFTGPLASDAISQLLSISDLYVAFYPDGASTRRTSLLAALAHGIPTISNRGENTDRVLESSGAVVLLEDGERQFQVVRDLCSNSQLRKRLGEQGRRFHDENHAWSRITEAYLRMMANGIE